jgi:hypothetical protein
MNPSLIGIPRSKFRQQITELIKSICHTAVPTKNEVFTPLAGGKLHPARKGGNPECLQKNLGRMNLFLFGVGCHNHHFLPCLEWGFWFFFFAFFLPREAGFCVSFDLLVLNFVLREKGRFIPLSLF